LAPRATKWRSLAVEEETMSGPGEAKPMPPDREQASAPAALPRETGSTFVLVHGAWHGGWCWRQVAEALRAEGHRVFTPTQTGLGERRHLLSHGITIETFIEDIANVLIAEELSDVILVGHSFGALAISGVADRMPERIRRLVYLDGTIIEGGERPYGVLAADVVAARRKLAIEEGDGLAVPPPPVTAFGIPDDHPDAAWARRRLTPHPAETYESMLMLRNPVGNGLPRVYIACTEPAYAPLERVRQWVRRQKGWEWRDIATGHDAMITAPAELSRMLIEIAGEG
jgi:pimeloyl-ACP methyl ester carboxylesterase